LAVTFFIWFCRADRMTIVSCFVEVFIAERIGSPDFSEIPRYIIGQHANKKVRPKTFFHIGKTFIVVPSEHLFEWHKNHRVPICIEWNQSDVETSIDLLNFSDKVFHHLIFIHNSANTNPSFRISEWFAFFVPFENLLR
jgi:hypothetical protein